MMITKHSQSLLTCLVVCFLTTTSKAVAQDAFDSTATGAPTGYVMTAQTSQGGTIAPRLPAEVILWLEPICADEPIPLRGFPPLPITFDLDLRSSQQAPVLQGATEGTSGPASYLIETYVSAESLVRDGKLEEAIGKLERAYFEQPDERFAALIALALTRQHQNDLAQLWEQRAEKEPLTKSKKRAAQISVDNPKIKDSALANNNQAVRLGHKNRWDEAIKLHELALKEAPDRADYITNLSSAHMQYGQWLEKKAQKQEAIAQYRAALFVDHKNGSAAELLTKAMGKDGSDAVERRKIAKQAQDSGDKQTELVEYGELAKMQPDDPAAQTDYGYVLLKNGEIEAGYKKLREAVAMEWPKDKQDELAVCHMRLGDILKEKAFQFKDSGRGLIGIKILKQAGIEYRRSIQLNYKNMEACKSYRDMAREAVSIRPSFDNTLALASAYLLCGDYKQAQTEFKRCFALNSKRPELDHARISYHQTVARSLLASDEQVSESAESIKRLIDNDSENARLWYILGRLREHQRDFEKAKKCYDRAWSLNKHIDVDLPLAYHRIFLELPGAAGESNKQPVSEPKVVKGSAASVNPIAGPFIKELQVRIKQNWNPPRSLDSSKVVVAFKIHKDGKISDVKIENSAGKNELDQAALDAIKNSQAPPVPEGLSDPVDIQFSFDYNVHTPLYY